MKNSTLIFILLSASVFFTGCTSDETTSALLQHPEKLQKQLMLCQIHNTQSPFCDEIKKTAAEFSALISEHNLDPSKFGTKLLTAQIELAKQQNMLTEIKKEIVSSPNQPKQLQEKFSKTQQAYQNQLHKVEILLAATS